MTGLTLGIDLGTSGIRSAVLNDAGAVLSTARAAYGPQDPDHVDACVWWQGVAQCIQAQIAQMQQTGLNPGDIARIGVDGTSGSMVLTDETVTPVTRALMYNSSGFDAQAAAIAKCAPNPHITQGSGSALARMLVLQDEDTGNAARHLLHQADFISARLLGYGGWSDHNNALKTGFDPGSESWPDWVEQVGVRRTLLPQVKPAGAPIAPICAKMAQQLGLSPDTMIHAGTTDSIAAFLAAAPLEQGMAVTSLGTTLAVKLLSPTRVDAPDVGLYAHKVGGHWLVGGASNTGGGVLANLFSTQDMRRLSDQIDPMDPSDLDYYPLLRPGERFPIKDPNFQPRMTPRPDSDVAFLHGLLESIARIEAQCYHVMQEMGAIAPSVIFTAGGGASNPVWTQIRQRVLDAPIKDTAQTEAAVGIAKLVQAQAHHAANGVSTLT